MANPSANAGTASTMSVTGAGSANLGFDLTNYITSIQPSYARARLDVTTLGNTARRFIGGFVENGYELEGVWDTTLDALMFPLVTAGSAAPIVYYPAGTASGKTRHDSTAVLLSYSPPTGTEQAVTWTASYAVEGSVSRTTIA